MNLTSRLTQALVALAIGGAARLAYAERTVLDGIAASVDGHVITIGDLAEAVEPVRRQFATKLSGAELSAKLRGAYAEGVESLIERRLILDSPAKENLNIPEWAVERRIGEIVRDMFKGDRAALLDALAQDRMTFEQWRERMREGIVLQAIRGKMVDDNVRISPHAVRQVYDSHLENYRSPETARLRMIVLKKGSGPDAAAQGRARADDLRRKLLAGADFATVARENSEGSKAEQGGDWGWIEPGTLRQELAKAVAAAKLSTVSDVIETDEELYLFVVEGRREAAIAPFPKVYSQIEKELRRQESSRLYRRWIERLKERSFVKTFELPLSP
jgi:peptidyl-prolyl cis-trans isomerase SurA